MLSQKLYIYFTGLLVGMQYINTEMQYPASKWEPCFFYSPFNLHLHPLGSSRKKVFAVGVIYKAQVQTILNKGRMLTRSSFLWSAGISI